MGLPKAINGAEISSIADVPASITYNAHPQEDGSMYVTIEAGAGVVKMVELQDHQDRGTCGSVTNCRYLVHGGF